ncbi:unnamed protein product [Camellia sinensis]
MAREFARSFVAKIAEYLAGALIAEYFVRLLGREFGYVIFYRSYLDKLREEGKKLEEKSGAVQLSVDLGRRNRGIIGPDVQGWLERAKECIDEASEILEDENRGCLNGWCPNLKLRHSLGRKAANKAKEVAHLNQEGTFTRVSYPPYNKKGFLRRTIHAVKTFLRGAWKNIRCKRHATVRRC